MRSADQEWQTLPGFISGLCRKLTQIQSTVDGNRSEAERVAASGSGYRHVKHNADCCDPRATMRPAFVGKMRRFQHCVISTNGTATSAHLRASVTVGVLRARSLNALRS